MKPYFDAGLKELAKAAGYQTASIQTCSQFKRTNQFIFEVWEALFRAMIHAFLEDSGTQDPMPIIREKII